MISAIWFGSPPDNGGGGKFQAQAVIASVGLVSSFLRRSRVNCASALTVRGPRQGVDYFRTVLMTAALAALGSATATCGAAVRLDINSCNYYHSIDSLSDKLVLVKRMFGGARA
jgi:hypothetical protein